MNKKINTSTYIILFIITLFVSYFASCYSPFYNMSFLNYDSSVFYLMGRGIKNGYIPYLDLADHKGIYIFLVNYLGALISENSYIGIFLVNLLISYFYITVTYKIVALFSQGKAINIMTAASTFILSSSYFFCQGGMKCETMLMPIVLYTHYLYLQHLLNNSRECFNCKKVFIVGIGFSITLFTKANICICFLSIIIFCIIDILKKREYDLFVPYCIFGLLGIFIGIMPAIIYGFLTNSLKEMFYYTFTVNFLYIGGLYYEYKSLMDAIINTIITFKWVLLFSIIGLFTSKSIVKNKRIFLFLSTLLISNIIVSFMALRPYTYHAYPMLFNIMWFFVFFYNILDGLANMIHSLILIKKKYIISVFLIIIISSLSFYTYRFSYKENLVHGYKQYLVNKKIEKHYKKDNKILVIGAAIGTYNYLETFPPVKHFCPPHTTEKFIKPMYDELLESIKSCENDWVITAFTPIMNRSSFPRKVNELLDEKYTYVDNIPLAPATIYKRLDKQ